MISDNLQPIINWLSHNPNLAYFLIFLLSLSESLVVVGLIVPGIAIMTIIGTFVGAGYLGLWPTFIMSVLGAIVGDGLSYWIGQRFQSHIRQWWLFKRYPELISRCERFFIKHGGKSVVLGRFVGPVRPMIPAVAGMLKMPPSYFYTVNIISAFLWAPVYLFPGIIFGTSVAQLSPEVSKKLISLLFISLLIIWVLTKIIKAIIYQIRKKIRQYSNKIFLYVENNSLEFLQKIIRHPLTHRKQQADSFLFLVLILIITLTYIFFTKAKLLTTALNPFFKHLALMLHNNSSNYNDIFIAIANNCSPVIILLCFVYILGYFAVASLNKTKKTTKENIEAITRNNIETFKRTIFLTCLLITSYFITTYFVTNLVAYPAPFELNYNIFYYSFPNFNIGLLTLLLGYIGIIKYCNNPIAYRTSSFNLYAVSILIFFTLLSLYLGFAWFSDLIGAILISSCLLLIFCIIYWQKPLEGINFTHLYKIGSFIITTLIIINSIVFYFSSNTKHDLRNANANIITINTDQNTWQKQNLFADTLDPVINIQWLAEKNEIIKILNNSGWSKQPEFDFSNILNLFKSIPEPSVLPLAPKYYLDHNASIKFSKFEPNNKILSLRLWQSEYAINNKKLWIGTVEYLKPKKYFKLITLLEHWPRAEFANATEKLQDDLEKFDLKTKIIFDKNKIIDGKLKIILIN